MTAVQARVIRETFQWLAIAILGLSAAAHAARPPADEIRTNLDRILAKPEYQQAYSEGLQSWVNRITQWLNQLFQGIWGDGAYQLRETWPGLYWAIVAILTIALMLLLYHIGWTLSAAFGTSRRRSKPVSPMSTAPPDVLRTRAADLAAAGRYEDAIRLLQEALLRFLDVKGLVHFDRSRTNWEYAEVTRAHKPLGAAMEALARRLDGLLYGGEVATRESYTRCAELVGQAWVAAEELL